MKTLKEVKEAFERIRGLIECEEAKEDCDILEAFIKEREKELENNMFQDLKGGISKRIHLSGEAGAKKWGEIFIKHKNTDVLSIEKKEALLKKACKFNKICLE